MRRPSTTTADAAAARLQTVPRLLNAGASGGSTPNGFVRSSSFCTQRPLPLPARAIHLRHLVRARRLEQIAVRHHVHPMIADGVDVAEQLPARAIDLDQPSRRTIRSSRDARQPYHVAGEFQAERLAERGPLAQELSFAIEALDAPVFAVGDVDHALVVDLNRVRQAELSGTRAGAAPFAQLLAIG